MKIMMYENENMKRLLDEILPFHIENDLQLDYADIDLERTWDYILAHILEIPLFHRHID